MVGTFINVSAILIGGLIGLAFGRKIPKRYQETLLNAMGLFTLAYGVYVFSKTQNVLVPLASIVIGTILGEWWQLEARLERIGSKLQSKFQSGSQPGDDGRNLFIEGFMTASVLYCTGPMAIVGSITDGLSGDFQMLAIKSVLDGLTAVAFASTMGMGVLFSALMVLLYQGGITLAAKLLGRGFDPSVTNEMTAVGGIILMGIAVSSLLNFKKIRTANMLPGLFVAVLIVLVLAKLGWQL
ncbi:MAG TPA: DUF554 domain-containing protein [Anaerolineaceae bacterium]|nr:DUF554 domain-containing protein [Anaerolineaceae bacterium]